ncbi:PAH-inducible cytochrome P450 monooxygenase PC-PAH 1 [Ramaria rubella]|nr:PAH-inducible cytochrome P450 monooxygenase PC-PAH 1 [Ramaria rubella]
MPSDNILVGPSLLVALLVLYFVWRVRARFVAQLPGPPAGSWLVGNVPDILRAENVGDSEFEWTRTFGNSVCIKGPFRRDILFTVDPKTLQYILNTPGYRYPKSNGVRYLIRILTGKGIVWADREQHARHRRIMNPAFSLPSIRSFLPFYQEHAKHGVAKLQDLVAQSGTTSSVINVSSWLTRITLDVMGSVLDCHLGALSEDTDNELRNAYKGLLIDTYHNRADFTIAAQDISGYLPEWLIPVIQRLPSPNVAKLRKYMDVANRTAQSLVDRELASFAAGDDGGNRIMSHLVRANMSQVTRDRLNTEELLAQLTSLLLAGHETTATAVTWTLYELSKHPDFQSKVREEIMATCSRASQRAQIELSLSDLESMPYLAALIKETLRFHPPVAGLTRVADQDDVLPLSVPHKTKTGEMITELPVSKGQRIIISIAGYNRLPDVWGKDADVWNPERFLTGFDGLINEKSKLGVYANLATFSSGERNCIGWRFAVLEMQAILAELITNFEFSPPPGNVEIIRAPTNLMVPLVRGSETRNIELPLVITPVA